MCGFLTYIHDNPSVRCTSAEKLKEMADLIEHRGPDSGGFYENNYISMVFKRLSIIDLSAAGSQPLSYDDEKYWIVFNGEIYNHNELREELKADNYTFNTATDTEVILAAYKKYGTDVANKLRGMFGFIIWDSVNERIYGARDHFGIKPFYYMPAGNGEYFFASEKKCFEPILNKKTLSQEALQHYLTFQYVPEPFTLYEEVSRVEAGSYFIKEKNKELQFFKYWEPNFAINKDLSEEHAVDMLREVLHDSVKKHMFADVTVGSFLSGGIDSSLIVAIAHKYNKNLKTFTVGFEREGYSEIDLAKETSEYIGVQNYRKVITPNEFMEYFPKYIWHMDDPLADPAALAQFFCAELARKQCTVALSGEGSDELFGGYNIYNEPNSLKMFNGIPKPLLNALSRVSDIMPHGMKGKSFLQRGTTPLEERFVGNAKIFTEEGKRKLLVNYNNSYPYTKLTAPFYEASKHLDDITRMQYVDIKTWLVGDILPNADKTSMAFSLELRTPYLDKEVFEVAKLIPTNLRVVNGTTKYVLRKAAKGILHEEVLNRKKLGFPVPIKHWLKNELYDWTKNIIETSKMDNYFDKKYVLSMLEEHKNGKQDLSRGIWAVITIMVWYDVYNLDNFNILKK